MQMKLVGKASGAPDATWDTAYERKALLVLATGYGLVGLDRFIINPLFPIMQRDLGLNYRDFGMIAGVLAFTWGIASVISGRLADRAGTKAVMVPAMIVFSLLSATSGLAGGLISLLVVRALMGMAEGAYVPASVVSTIAASRPTRIGLNVGLQQLAMPLIGLGFGPILVAFLLRIFPGWHWVFIVASIPGLLLVAVMSRVLRDTRARTPDDQDGKTPSRGSWLEVLRYRAVIVNTLGMFCYLTCMIILTAFMPNYLTDHLKLNFDKMSIVLAGMGFGSVGLAVVPALSDRWGYRRTVSAALVVELAALIAVKFCSTDIALLFCLLFIAMFMNAGVVSITVGPLTHRAVPAYLRTSATGMVVGLGEIVGGAISPAVTGMLAQKLGIEIVVILAPAAIAVGLIVMVLGVGNSAAEICAVDGTMHGGAP
ncbi:MFS transporter [Paraburkholderia acidicola]|uniref:MFS transporter n=1 Tax=Paraburkholderia acidicola TaxID=1912599 RepID=A0ABV1LUM7_9BURK